MLGPLSPSGRKFIHMKERTKLMDVLFIAQAMPRCGLGHGALEWGHHVNYIVWNHDQILSESGRAGGMIHFCDAEKLASSVCMTGLSRVGSSSL